MTEKRRLRQVAQSDYGGTSSVILSGLSKPLRDRVDFDLQTETLTVTGELDQGGMRELQECFSTPEAKQVAEEILHETQGRRVAPSAPAQTGSAFKVPQLAIRVDGELKRFDEGSI